MLIVITPVAILPKILSLNCFASVISLNNFALSIATAAWFDRDVNMSRSNSLKSSTPLLVSLSHRIINPNKFSLALRGTTNRLSSFSFFCNSVFSLLVNIKPLSPSLILFNTSIFFDSKNLLSPQLNIDKISRIGL